MKLPVILPLLPVLLLAQCWTLPQPAHATPNQAIAHLDEGSHAAWTRCAAGVLGSRLKSCTTNDNLTVCGDRNGRSMWSSVWQEQLGAVYLSTGGDAPVRMGEYVVQDTLTDARFVVGGQTYRCGVYLRDGYMVVAWDRVGK